MNNKIVLLNVVLGLCFIANDILNVGFGLIGISIMYILNSKLSKYMKVVQP